MSRPRTTVAWALLACACARDDAERHELDGLVVVEDFDEPICAGTFSYLQRSLDALERRTGLPPDPLGLIFHWIYEEDMIASYCGDQAGACAPGRDFYTSLNTFSHELAHAHLSRLGRPRVWLVEGMAVMLEEGFSGAPDPVAAPSDMLRIEDPRGLDYSSAGAFTVYLRDRYGMPKLLEYYAATDKADVDSSVAAFREVFGDDFSAVEADYLASDMPLVVGFRDCDVAEVAWADNTWSHSFALTCDDPATIGPQQPVDEPERPILWANVTMTVPAGGFTFNLEASGPVWITIVRCDRPEAVFLSADETQTEVALEGGRYLVFADTYVDIGSSATITARRLAVTPNLVTRPDAPPSGFITHRARDRRHE